MVDMARPERPPGDRHESIEEKLARRDAVRQEHAGYFEAKANDLLAGQDAIIETTEGSVRARLVRFRSGAVFEDWNMSHHSTGHGMRRVEPTHLSDPVSILVSHLVDAMLELGPDARPMR